MKNKRDIETLKKAWLNTFIDTLIEETEKVILDYNDIQVIIPYKWQDLKLTKNLYFQVDSEQIFNHPYDLRYADYLPLYSDKLRTVTVNEKYDMIFDSEVVKELRIYLRNELEELKSFLVNQLNEVFSDYDYIEQWELKAEFTHNILKHFNRI